MSETLDEVLSPPTPDAEPLPGKAGRGPKRRAKPMHRLLLDAAAAELIEGGGQMEIAAVAARVGVSVGLSYHYFGSKGGLLAAVVDDFYDRYDAAVIDLNPLPHARWAERERRRVALLVDFLLSEPLAPLVLGRLSAEPDVAAVEARRLARHIELGATNIALAQERGDLPAGSDPRLMIAMIMGGLRQAVGQVLAGRIRHSGPEKLADELWNLIAATAGLGGHSG